MIKITHVGGLPRGPELVPLLLAHDKGAQGCTRASAIAKVELVNLQPLHGEIRPFTAVAWKKLAALRSGVDIADARIG